jgi:hypothetical protein
VLPVPAIADLAQFTGRDEDTFSPFADEALAQSTLLFTTVTKLVELPDDPDQAQLAINGILEMARQIYLTQPYAEMIASPFVSETIGSYTYSKISAAARVVVQKAKNGEPTGMMWWDLAVDELSLKERSRVDSKSVLVFNNGLYSDSVTGDRYVLGPADRMTPASGYMDIATGWTW